MDTPKHSSDVITHVTSPILRIQRLILHVGSTKQRKADDLVFVLYHQIMTLQLQILGRPQNPSFHLKSPSSQWCVLLIVSPFGCLCFIMQNDVCADYEKTKHFCRGSLFRVY